MQTGLHVGRGLPPVQKGWIAHGSEPVSTSQCDCESMLKTKKQVQGHTAMLSGEAATETIGATDQRSGIPGNSWTSGARKGTQRGRTHKPAHCPTSCKVDSPQPGPSPAWGGGTGQEGEVPGASRDSSCIIFTSPHPFCRWEIESHSCSESGFKPRSVGFLLPSREGWTGRPSAVKCSAPELYPHRQALWTALLPSLGSQGRQGQRWSTEPSWMCTGTFP